MPNFEAKVFQNQYLTAGADEVHAVVSVKSLSGGAPAASRKARTVGIIADKSGSMSGDKIRNTRTAICTAIELLDESDYFFVIAGNESGNAIVESCQATKANKARAISVVKTLTDGGDTYISTWLDKALTEFRKTPGNIAQAVLLTDGANNDSDAAPLERMLAKCEGIFQCDCRGVGADWKPDQLRKIAAKLLGSVEMIRDASGMTADFSAMINKAKGLAVSDVSLQIWLPVGAEVKFIKQVSPEILELTGKRKDGPNAQTGRYPTGAWGEESRDYHVSIKVKPGQVGQKMLAGRAALVYVENGQETKIGEGQILAIWTDDDALSAVINPQVANYTGQAELAAKVQEGLEARKAGDEDRATKALKRAHELASETGNEGTKRLIEKVVDVEKDGTVRLKKKVDDADAVELDTRSTKTKRVS